jgi:hypothetical protein
MPRDIWSIATDAVDNPAVVTRMLHSAIGTEFKRAAKWSTMGKIVKKGVNIAASFIPVPLVGSLVGIAADKVQAEATSASHKGKLSKYKGNTKKAVKFGWKDKDISHLDRFRYKIEESGKNL